MSGHELGPRLWPLLDDAGNLDCSMHTRYAAACRALGACCDEGLGDDADRTTLSVWETRRYWEAISDPPTEIEVAAVIARVHALLETAQRA